MKKFVIYLVVVLTMVLLFVGCSTESKHEEIPVNPGQKVEEVVNQRINQRTNNQNVSKEYQQEVEFNSKHNVGA